MNEQINESFTTLTDKLEHLASLDMNKAREQISSMPTKQAIQLLIWCIKYKPEAIDFVYECIAKTYTPIIVKSADKYVALFDYLNPTFAKGVEGTCQITSYDAEGNILTCSRLVYKLTEKYQLYQLIKNCLEFIELPCDNLQIVENLGAQLLKQNEIEKATISTIF